MRLALADVVWSVHTVVTVFFLVAWALPWRWALWTAALGAVAMRVQWWLNDGVCVLTKAERVLRGLSAVPRSDEEGFVAALLSRLAGRTLSREASDTVTYALLWSCAGLAVVRLASL